MIKTVMQPVKPHKGRLVLVADIDGPALDWAVAKALGKPIYKSKRGDWMTEDYGAFNGRQGIPYWMPTRVWDQGGPIIEMNNLGVWFSERVEDEHGSVEREAMWYCETCCTTANGDETYRCETGHSPLVAAMRCFVASKLGDEVEVPL